LKKKTFICRTKKSILMIYIDTLMMSYLFDTKIFNKLILNTNDLRSVYIHQ